MAEARVTQNGILVETDQTAQVNTSQLGVLVEMSNDTLRVTQNGILVEFSTDTVSVSQLGILVEMEEAATTPLATYFEPVRSQVPIFKLPDIVSGYQLDSGNSFWSVVVPEYSKNLFENPSLELGSRGFVDANFASVLLSSEKASRGCQSLKCVPDGASEGYVYQGFNPLTTGIYTVSIDLWAMAGTTFNLIGRDGTDRAVLIIQPTKTGWARYSLSFPVYALGSSWQVRLVSSSSNTSQQYFYTDGWQVENKPYATTYFDGDSIDDSWEADPNAYLWTGLPHGSASIRSSTVWNGGRIVSLYSVDFRTTGIVGLGMTAPEQDQVLLYDGREISTNSINQPRDFSIIGRLINCSMESINQQRQTLINVLDPNRRNSGKMILRYQPVDRYGSQFGKALNIPCTFVGGLEGNMIDLFNDQLELKFHTNDGKIYEDFNEVVTLNEEDYSLRGSIIYRNPTTGELTSLGGNVIGGIVQCATVMRNGDIVVGGTFTSIGGVAAKRIAVYSFATNTWSQLGQGLNNGGVLAMSTCFDGTYESVMFGGSFTLDGDGVDCRRIAEWFITSSGSTADDFNEVGGGLNADVYCIEYHPVGWYYVGGNFTANVAGTGLSLSKIARVRPFLSPSGDFDPLYHGSNPLDFADGAVSAILPLKSPSIMFTGNFMSENESALTLAGVAQYDPVNFILTAVGNGIERSGLVVTSQPLDIRADAFGVPHIGGILETGTDLAPTYPGILRFNGSRWLPLFDEQYSFETGVLGFDFDTNGNILLLTYDLDYRLDANGSHEWNGVNFIAPHAQLDDESEPLNSDQNVQLVKPSNSLLYITPAGSSDPFRLSSQNTVTYRGTAPTQVTFTSFVYENMASEAYIFRRMTNRTTGDDLVMNIDQNEISDVTYIEYHFDRLTPSVIINKQLNVTNQLLATSSSYTFSLLPGTNYIQVALKEIIAGEEFTYTMLMTYVPTHWSIDAATQA